MNVGREQRTTVWSLHICLPWSLVTKDRSTAVSLCVWSPAVQRRWKMYEPSIPGVFWNRARLSLSGALCSACSFTLGKRKKPCSFKGLLERGFSDPARFLLGESPEFDHLHVFSFPLLLWFKGKGFSHKPLRTGLPRPLRAACLPSESVMVSVLVQYLAPTKWHEESHFPSLGSHFPHPYNLEGRLDDTRFSYSKCQRSTWENVWRKSSTRGSVKNCYPGSWESHVYLPALASACGFPLPTSCFPLVAWLLSRAKHSAWWWERMLYKTNTPLLSVDLCLVGKVAQEWNN